MACLLRGRLQGLMPGCLDGSLGVLGVAAGWILSLRDTRGCQLQPSMGPVLCSHRLFLTACKALPGTRSSEVFSQVPWPCCPWAQLGSDLLWSFPAVPGCPSPRVGLSPTAAGASPGPDPRVEWTEGVLEPRGSQERGLQLPAPEALRGPHACRFPVVPVFPLFHLQSRLTRVLCG